MKTVSNMTKKEFNKILKYICRVFPEFKNEYKNLFNELPQDAKDKLVSFEDFNIKNDAYEISLSNGYSALDKNLYLKTKDKVYMMNIVRLNDIKLEEIVYGKEQEIACITVEDLTTAEETSHYVVLSKLTGPAFAVKRITETDDANFNEVERKYNDKEILSYDDVCDIFSKDSNIIRSV